MTAAVLIPLILQAIQAAIAAAPGALDVVAKGKEFISALFSAGVISKEQQDICHAYVDNVAQMVAAGIVPPGLQVQPDPK